MAETEASNNDVRDRRIGEILGDLYDRKARGEVLTEAQILAEHPDLADDLRRYLAVIGELTPADHDIDGLVAHGVLAPSDDPEYPASLGIYRPLEFIGRGGMGIVLKAHEEGLDRTVALKIIRPDLASDGSALARFQREAKAAAALRHPNIVTVHAVGEERGVHFLAMEYVEGPTLADVIHEHAPLPTETVRRLFRHLLDALTAAHDAGIIHRDVKPSNLLLDVRAARVRSEPRASASGSPTHCRPLPHGRGSVRRGSDSDAAPEPKSSIVNLQSSILKLADFGLARMAAARTRITTTKATPGTPEYMSPEQARGDENLDHHTDLYSAGVVLYELLTGRTPFRADSETAVIHRILHEDPADPRTISKHADLHLASLALRLMAKRPEDRFESATETINALKASERVRSLEKRRRFRRHVLTALIAFGLIVGAGWLTQRLVAGRGELSDVRIDPDTRLSIQARYGDDPKWRQFHIFASEAREVNDVVRVDLDGRGHLAVVASIAKPLDKGDSLFAFHTKDRPLWSMNLSSGRPWPDYKTVTQWPCYALAATDVDNKPGDEIIVVAHDSFEYPTRVSIVDPSTEEIKASFWHFGQISLMWVVSDFFGSGHPAIIASGKNNKLDGFYEPKTDDPKKLTGWDVVSVMMILDPREMLRQGDGLGPPRTERVDIPPLIPHAYAFVSLPPSEQKPSVSPRGGQDTDQKPSKRADIVSVLDEFNHPDDDTGPCFSVVIQHPEDQGSATLIVDRNLALVRIIVADGIKTATDDAYWREYWRPIIQNGKYIGE